MRLTITIFSCFLQRFCLFHSLGIIYCNFFGKMSLWLWEGFLRGCERAIFPRKRSLKTKHTGWRVMQLVHGKEEKGRKGALSAMLRVVDEWALGPIHLQLATRYLTRHSTRYSTLQLDIQLATRHCNSTFQLATHLTWWCLFSTGQYFAFT